jgi:hypothetical protein
MTATIVSFVTFAASSIILTGTFVGPDYTMTIDSLGQAHVEWYDGQSANIQFNVVYQTEGNATAKGITVNSTAPMRTMTGDTITLSTRQHTIIAMRPDGTVRTVAAACWEGFNRSPNDPPAYPCD